MARTLSLTRHRRIFLRVLTQHRFLMLFLFLLATLIAYPYTEGRSSRFYAFRVLSGLIIALSVYVVVFVVVWRSSRLCWRFLPWCNAY